MKRMVKYPSISQFRQTVKDITERACYIGKDNEGKPVFDYLKPKPVVTFTCSTKLHGTNASVCYSISDGLWAQSRENIITVEKDNMGFAFFVEQNKSVIISIIEELAKIHNIDLNKNIISVYGEWCGKGVQKAVAISELDKRFVIFQAFKVSPLEPSEDEKAIWYGTEKIDSTENKIWNIMNFKTWSFDIDFNTPERKINELLELVEEIETECPVAKEFGVSGVGEGFVATYLSEDGALIQCKFKGEKHSNSKVKTTKAVDTEKLDAIDKCIEEICHSWRFEQALREVFGPDYEKTLDRKRIGEYLKFISTDTIKEESDLIAKYGFEPKDVMGKVSQKAKEYFFAVENQSF